MNITTIDGSMLKHMFQCGSKNLEYNKKKVDALNVFPVPDGDTGTNMSLTFSHSVSELGKLDKDSLYAVAKTASSGALIGARGNSGVILSQLLRGVAKGCKDKKQLDIAGLAAVVQAAADAAYKAVMKPTEGTILTVAREMGEYATQHQDEYQSMDEFIRDIIAQGKDALARTPELLPVLKEAGVVDAGGQGLIFILEGAYKGLIGEEIEAPVENGEAEESETGEQILSPEDITFTYDTEFTIKNASKGEAEDEKLKMYLEMIGDTVRVIRDGAIVKVHVHTDHPGKAMEKAEKLGSLVEIKIDNLRDQLGLLDEEPQAEHVPYGFVAVSPGEGLTKLFHDLGITRVISGGQTMNPSTQDFLNEIDKINADNIFLFPNNGNIIMAANQAQSMSEKNIHVIPTKTIPQCVTAMLSFDPDAQWEDNDEAMKDSIETVKCGEVTYAVRDTKINGMEIFKNDVIGIYDGEILTKGSDINGVTMALVEKLIDEDSELISVYYGKDVKEADAGTLVKALEDKFDECDVELGEGGQPLYYYIVSVE